MTRFVILATAFVLAGCVGPAIVPDGGVIASAREVRIVAMESPPLGVGPNLLGDGSFPGVAVVGDATARAAGAVILIQTILVAANAPDALRQAEQQGQVLRSVIDSGKAWLPTTVLASEVRTQLEALGLRVSVAPEPQPVPGVVDRTPSVWGENWLAPIRAWYNAPDAVSGSATATQGAQGLVFEVGISNYEILTGERFILQVHIKVIDPSNGRVIGRARAANPGALPRLSPLSRAFEDQARLFKEVFALESRRLVGECLRELGFLPAR